MILYVFLNWDGLFTTYHRFLSHLQCKLEDSIVGSQMSGMNLVFGSDEEKAPTKAVKSVFPSSDLVLCMQHISKNVNHHLIKIGVEISERRKIMDTIFGATGLMACKEEYEYLKKAMELHEKYVNEVPTFANYFKNLTDKLLENVVKSRNKNKWIPLDWKNNSCESLNNILKLAVNWKTLKLPDLINRINNIVKLQLCDIRRAIHGTGNFKLAPWMAKFAVKHVNWVKKSEAEKENVYRKFMKGPKKLNSHICSTDGGLTIPTVAKSARKPGQKHRVKNAKTQKVRF
ncbi:uncharacterized protein LOC117101325 [Anneissia japonica]|uniref:uncharacterized protein LOC117101325 n=1 Tax=Anneissia japonica TaxID=1529436 RepID=UPI0014257D1C|nr:uncharacterized protein LOC117101325 [Anneissia japonica]